MIRSTRPVSWIKAALREFEIFPNAVKSTCLTASTIAAEGGKADIAKPMQGLGSGVFEIALAYRVTLFVSFMRCNWARTFRLYVHFRKHR